MYVELKDSHDFLLMQLRRLLRETKKAEIELHCIAEGSFDRSINLSQAGLGPFTRQRKERLWLFVKKDHHWSKLHLQIHPDNELDIENIVLALKNMEGQHHLPPFKDEKQHLSFHPVNEDNVDEELINLEFKESANFFRSRFLIDAPKKILFEGRMSTGYNYQAYTSEDCPLVFQPYSHYGIDAWLRTRDIQVQFIAHGFRLREMLLSRVRNVISPFWSATHVDPSEESLPNKIIFSSTCLLSLMQAVIKSQKEGNQSLWNWLRTWNGEGDHSLGLHPKNNEAYSPLSRVILKALERNIHPAGENQMPLSQLLNGHLTERHLYIQDIAVDIDGEDIWVTTKGSSLIVSQEKTSMINIPLFFSLRGEMIQSASCSNLSVSSLGFDHMPCLVPEYAIIHELHTQVKASPH